VNEILFVEEREQDWRRLKLLCDRADASPALLHGTELRELVRLYRRVSGDLALVRTRSANSELIEFLNGLCARAYAIVYRPRGTGLRKAMGAAAVQAARTVRRRAAFVLASGAMLLGFALFAFVAMERIPDSRETFVPEQMEEVFDHWKRGDLEERSSSESFAMTLFYSGNNPMAAVSTGAIAAGTFGIGTLEILRVNGGMLGALSWDMRSVGKLGFLYASIMPHGVTELSGLVIAGGAGFVLGWALLRPGRRSRGDALREAGKDAVVLLATAVALMFIAAPIEGFFSFNPRVPEWAKLSFAALTAAAWAAFWIGYGRKGEPIEKVEPEAFVETRLL